MRHQPLFLVAVAGSLRAACRSLFRHHACELQIAIQRLRPRRRCAACCTQPTRGGPPHHPLYRRLMEASASSQFATTPTPCQTRTLLAAVPCSSSRRQRRETLLIALQDKLDNASGVPTLPRRQNLCRTHSNRGALARRPLLLQGSVRMCMRPKWGRQGRSPLRGHPRLGQQVQALPTRAQHTCTAQQPSRVGIAYHGAACAAVTHLHTGRSS